MKSVTLLSIIILGVSVSPFTASAAVLYVAPNGADGAAGTQAQPLSLRAALERSLFPVAPLLQFDSVVYRRVLCRDCMHIERWRADDVADQR